MELRQYWKLFRRRWLFVLVPAMIVLAVGLVTYRRPAPVYSVGVRFLVGQSPSVNAQAEDRERLANWQASEYIVNGLTDWVRGGKFAEAVAARLASQGRNIPAAAIQAGIGADNVRSQMLFTMSYSNPDDLAAMMAAAIELIKTENGAALPQLGGDTAVLVQLDEPNVARVPAGLRSQLDLPLRLALALAAGLGLALLVDYLDPTVRERDDLARLGLPILGEIPE